MTTTTTTPVIPNPLALAKQAEARRQAAQVEAESKAKLVRPGLVESKVAVIHDGVVKTKHLEPGMAVRPFVHGSPRGGERVIKSAKRLGDGAQWHVEFESAHVDADYKAAYRWYCEALDGATVQRTVKTPGFVEYVEV